MGKLTAYTQSQLASSLIGVPAVDRSGQIAAASLVSASNKIAGSVLDFNLRKIQAEDSLAVNRANESRDLAKLRTQKFMVDNPDPSTWEAGAAGILTEQEQFTTTQSFSIQTSRKENIKQKAFKNELNAFVGIASSRQTIQNDITASGKNMISIMGNPLSTDEEIKAQEDIYQAALERGKSKEIADVVMQETKVQGQEQKVENIKKVAMNFAAIEPQQTIESVNEELAARKKGETLFQEFSELSNSDLEAVKDYAGSVGNKQDSDSKVAMHDAISDSYSAIRNGAVNLDEMADAVELNQTISSEDSNEYATKVNSYFSMYNSAVKSDVITTNDTTIKMLRINSRVKNGSITRDDGLEQYKLLRSEVGVNTINTADNKAFLNGIFDSGEAAQNVATKKWMAVLGGREKKVRDAIEAQPNLLGGDESDELMKDLANEANIEFDDRFRDTKPKDYNNDDVDAEADRLISKYTLSIDQQTLAGLAKTLKDSENLKEQQQNYINLITDHIKNGRITEAEEAKAEAVKLGILELKANGDMVNPSKSNADKKVKKGGDSPWKRILEAIQGGR